MPISSPTGQFRVSETATRPPVAPGRDKPGPVLPRIETGRDEPVPYNRMRTPACMRRPLFEM